MSDLKLKRFTMGITEERFKDVRKKLDNLGYMQPLGFESLLLVEHLLADLIHTTDNLKRFQNIAQITLNNINELECDVDEESVRKHSTKFTKELNELRQNYTQEKDSLEKEQKALKNRIKQLESANADLEFVCATHLNEIHRLNCQLAEKGQKLLKLSTADSNSCRPNGVKKSNPKRSPYTLSGKDDVSTKRSLKTIYCSDLKNKDLLSVSNSYSENSNNFLCVESKNANRRLIDEVKSLKAEKAHCSEEIIKFRTQVRLKSEEVNRLRVLLEEERQKDSAMAVEGVSQTCRGCSEKHCCAKLNENNVDNLREQLTESQRIQHEAMCRAVELCERNKRLEEELKKYQCSRHSTTTSSDDHRNCGGGQSFDKEEIDKLKEIVSIKSKCINDLQNKLVKSEETVDYLKSSITRFNQILEGITKQRERLNERINKLTIVERDLMSEIERLHKLNEKQKMRLLEFEQQATKYQKQFFNIQAETDICSCVDDEKHKESIGKYDRKNSLKNEQSKLNAVRNKKDNKTVTNKKCPSCDDKKHDNLKDSRPDYFNCKTVEGNLNECYSSDKKSSDEQISTSDSNFELVEYEPKKSRSEDNKYPYVFNQSDCDECNASEGEKIIWSKVYTENYDEQQRVENSQSKANKEKNVQSNKKNRNFSLKNSHSKKNSRSKHKNEKSECNECMESVDVTDNGNTTRKDSRVQCNMFKNELEELKTNLTEEREKFECVIKDLTEKQIKLMEKIDERRDSVGKRENKNLDSIRQQKYSCKEDDEQNEEDEPCWIRLEKVQAERDHYYKELSRLRETIMGSCSCLDDLEEAKNKFESLQTKLERLLNERDFYEKEYNKLRENILHPASSRRTMASAGLEPSADNDAMNHLTMENDNIKENLSRLKEERDMLKNKIKEITEDNKHIYQKQENSIRLLEEKVNRLEKERCDLLTRINSYTENNESLENEFRQLRSDYCQIKSRYDHIKMLQEETDHALSTSQDILSRTEAELENTLERISHLQEENSKVNRDIGAACKELSLVKNNLNILDREKDSLLLKIDEKTEKLFILEREANDKDRRISQLEKSLDDLRQKYQSSMELKMQYDDSYEKAIREADELRQEVIRLERSYDGVVRENKRLQDNLASMTQECVAANRDLESARQEIEETKLQLQSYVFEVQRVEEIMQLKESERTDMLEQFRNLTVEATVLESNNNSLENEAKETKNSLISALDKVADLEQALMVKDELISGYENQIAELTACVASLEMKYKKYSEENKKLEMELDNVKDLCKKMEIHKNTLSRHVEEIENDKAKLEREYHNLVCEKNGLESKLVKERKNSETLENILSESRQETLEKNITCKQLRHQIEKLDRKVNDLQRKLQHGDEALKQCHEEASDYQRQVKELRSEVTDSHFQRTCHHHEEEEKTPDIDVSSLSST